MLNILEAIGNFCSMIANFVINVVTGLASMISLIPQSFGLIQYATAYMPSELAIFAMAAMLVCIVYLIIGR